jgi:NAD-dependent deacetylase
MTPAVLPADVARAREILVRAASVVVFTGAGVSAESGVPTFRGAGGLWQRSRPEDLATPEAFARDPRLVWEWYGWRRGLVASCAPNPAHRALAAWMARRSDVTLVTQNVDDLHERAGREAGAPLAPPRLLKLHGSLFVDRCSRCSCAAPGGPVSAATGADLPRCASCGALLRPGVVWFGEALPEAIFEAAVDAAHGCGACLVIGTAGAVYPAAGIVHAAHAAGAAVIVVDPGATEYDALAEVRLRGPAGGIVPELVR